MLLRPYNQYRFHKHNGMMIPKSKLYNSCCQQDLVDLSLDLLKPK